MTTNIIHLDTEVHKRKRRNRRRYYVQPVESPPVVRLLRAYHDLWTANPLWLRNLPGIPNPKRDPAGALKAACDLLRAADSTAGQVYPAARKAA